jgi:hypothetical protein
MSMLEGVSECWMLSRTCVVNWDAWAAVGTVSAVVVSLMLAGRQGRKEKAAQRSRARWVALELRQVLAAWRGRVTYAHRIDGADLYFLLNDEDFGDPTVVPQELIAFYDQLHELGDGAAPIADAIWITRQLERMPIQAALRGDIEASDISSEIERQYRAGLNSLRIYLLHAEENVSAITGLSAADPDRNTFGPPQT